MTLITKSSSSGCRHLECTKNQSISNMTSKPEGLSWHPGSYTMEYVLKNFEHHLPQVVQCDHTVCGSGKRSEEVGCGPPLLLYSLLNLPRAVGVSLVKDGGQGKALKGTKDRFVIPFDYKGWFILSGPKPKHDDVPVYKDVSAVVEAGCDCFLIGGNKKLDILRKVPSAYAYAPDLAHPGEKMKVMGAVQHEKTYLQCMDETNQIVLIDYESKGLFYMISCQKKTNVSVLQMKDIISSHQKKLPCVVKLLLGKGPLQDGSFTGWMKLTSIEKVPSVLACTVTIAENGLLEVPRCNPLKYRISTLNSGWKGYSGYKEALRLCRRFAEEYTRSMKSARVKVTSASVLRGVMQPGGPGQTLLDVSVSKGCAPGMTKTRHFQPRAVNTIFESESEETESVHEANGDYEMVCKGNINDREYENLLKFSQQTDRAAYAELAQNPGPASTTNTYLTEIGDSSPNRDVSRASSNNKYLTVTFADDEAKADSINHKTTNQAGITIAEIHSTDQSSLSVPQGYPGITMYANQECINELESAQAEHVNESDLRQMRVVELINFFDPVITEDPNDSHAHINVDYMALDEDVTSKSRSFSGSTSDYVNVLQPLEMRNTEGRRVHRTSASDSGVYSLGGDFDKTEP